MRNSADLGILEDAEQFHGPVDIQGEDMEVLRDMLEEMILIRCAEDKIAEGVASRDIVCPCHLAVGQEAVAVGFARHVKQGDKVFGAHRSHAHFLSLGGDLHQLFAEVQGKETGCSKGMGGSMHLIDIKHQLFGTVPIVAATIPIATGAALASKLDRGSSVAVSFFGDGATEEGAFHESLNFASVMRLPIIYVCENNLFSSHLHISLRQPRNSIARYAEAHAISWDRLDGNDVVALYRSAARAFEAARNGRGPYLIEAVTYRWRGHVGHREDMDVGVKRKENLALWKKRDPIRRLADALVMRFAVTGDQVDDIWRQARARVDALWSTVQSDPMPDPQALLDRVYYRGN